MSCRQKVTGWQPGSLNHTLLQTHIKAKVCRLHTSCAGIALRCHMALRCAVSVRTQDATPTSPRACAGHLLLQTTAVRGCPSHSCACNSARNAGSFMCCCRKLYQQTAQRPTCICRPSPSAKKSRVRLSMSSLMCAASAGTKLQGAASAAAVVAALTNARPVHLPLRHDMLQWLYGSGQRTFAHSGGCTCLRQCSLLHGSPSSSACSRPSAAYCWCTATATSCANPQDRHPHHLQGPPSSKALSSPNAASCSSAAATSSRGCRGSSPTGPPNTSARPSSSQSMRQLVTRCLQRAKDGLHKELVVLNTRAKHEHASKLARLVEKTAVLFTSCLSPHL
jgi:hypothetical protein